MGRTVLSFIFILGTGYSYAEPSVRVGVEGQCAGQDLTDFKKKYAGEDSGHCAKFCFRRVLGSPGNESTKTERCFLAPESTGYTQLSRIRLITQNLSNAEDLERAAKIARESDSLESLTTNLNELVPSVCEASQEKLAKSIEALKTAQKNFANVHQTFRCSPKTKVPTEWLVPPVSGTR